MRWQIDGEGGLEIREDHLCETLQTMKLCTDRDARLQGNVLGVHTIEEGRQFLIAGAKVDADGMRTIIFLLHLHLFVKVDDAIEQGEPTC